MSPLADGVEALVAHLHGKTLADVLAGTVEAPVVEPAPVAGVTATDVELPGSVPLRVRRYERDGAAGIRPAIVWAHGGAWMFGDLDMPEADAVARRLCLALDAVVVSVDYRLAPTHPYPAAMDDLVAAVEVTAEHPHVDAARVVVGGASAGGNLAAAAAQVLRDRGTVALAGVVLAYPATDPPGGPYPPDRPDVVPPLLWFDHDTTNGAFSFYVAGAEDAPYVVPAAGDLAGLPPTLVTTSSLDALEDQAVRYVELLRDAGVEVEHHRIDGVLHGYLNMTGIVAAADAALDRHADWIAARLDR